MKLNEELKRRLLKTLFLLIVIYFPFVSYLTAQIQIQPEWVRRYDGPADLDDIANDIVTDNDGNVYVTGEGDRIPLGNSDYVTIKYDELGNELWVKRYDGPAGGVDYAWDVGVDEDNNVFVTGVCFDGINDNYTTIKYDWAGNEEWIGHYNGPGDDFDEALALAVDNNGNVVVTGHSVGAGADQDYATIKYDQEGLALSVIPDTTVFHRGDMICFTVIMTNYGETSTSFQAWSEVELPSGSILSPRLGPVTLFLVPDQTISPWVCDGPIPMGAPFSSRYKYIVKLGTYPTPVLEERFFDFEIVGP
jgi:hypothetical protein